MNAILLFYWRNKVGKGEGTLLFTKAKSSKSFLDSALQNRGWILWILHFKCGILRNCGIAGGFESLKREDSTFWISKK